MSTSADLTTQELEAISSGQELTRPLAIGGSTPALPLGWDAATAAVRRPRRLAEGPAVVPAPDSRLPDNIPTTVLERTEPTITITTDELLPIDAAPTVESPISAHVAERHEAATVECRLPVRTAAPDPAHEAVTVETRIREPLASKLDLRPRRRTSWSDEADSRPMDLPVRAPTRSLSPPGPAADAPAPSGPFLSEERVALVAMTAILTVLLLLLVSLVVAIFALLTL